MRRASIYAQLTLCLSALALSPPASAEIPLWFTLSVDGGPVRYLNKRSALSPWRVRGGQGCVSALRSGDALTITRGPKRGHCQLKVGVMSGRALLAFGLKLNLNRASHDELTALRGVGPRLAAQLIQGRPWLRLEQLTQLKGIGPKRLRRLSQQLRVGAHPVISLTQGGPHER